MLKREDSHPPLVKVDKEFGGGGGTTSAKTKISFDTEDILALGAVILCVGAIVVAVIIAIAFAMGKVDGTAATKIILGCVGASTIAGICAKIVRAGGPPLCSR